MIKRYSNKEIESVFSDLNRFKIQTKLEELVTLFMLKKDSDKIKRAFQNIDFNLLCKRIKENEVITRHETVAFVNSLIEQLPEEYSSFIHKGLTSSDILDTTLNLQIIEAHDILIKKIDKLLSCLKEKAENHRFTQVIGRTHGVHGEITTFGHLMLGYHQEWQRNKNRLNHAIEEIKVCKLSGAMGNYVHNDPELEEYVSKKLNLSQEKAATQVVPRDRYANYISMISLCGSSLERISTWIRLLSQTEISEVSESFGIGQAGSSAMPHKRNPILSENLSGLSRMIKSHARLALDNVSLWYERDMSHSSVERVVIPDSFHLLTFSIDRLVKIVNNIFVNKENMCNNINMNDDYMSQSILINLMNHGLGRKEAYEKVKSMTMKEMSLKEQVLEDPTFTEYDIQAILNTKKYIKNINYIYKNCLKEENEQF